MAVTVTAFASAPARSPREIARESAAVESVAIGYLRAFVTLMVLAHHAMLAYHPFAPLPQPSLTMEPRSWLAFPIVDAQRSNAFLVLTTFNDVFGMSLLFFLSGLFVWQSLERKGARDFLYDRAVRLGVPFVVAAVVLTPLAYYPSYLVTAAHPSVAGFREVWLSMGSWPAAAGPAWFLWVLLAFDAVAAGLFALLPRSRDVLGRASSATLERPAAFFALLVVGSAVAYIPLAISFGPALWSTLGPFRVQTSRVLHYLVYFLAGGAVGIYGIERGLLAVTGSLARRWAPWVLLAFGAFVVAVGIALGGTAPVRWPFLWDVMGGVGFALSCAASSFALLAVFVRFVQTRMKLFDSLQANTYGMYVVHYVFVGWLQYALLPSPLSAFAKGALVFAGTAASSWTVTAALRRVPAIARVI